MVARSSSEATLTQTRTAALLCVFIVALWVLVLVSRPFNLARCVLVVAMAASFVVLLAVPWSRRIFALALPGAAVLVAVLAIALLAIVALTIAVSVAGHVNLGDPAGSGDEKDLSSTGEETG
jgi:cation-transporting ATPase E